MDSVLQLLDELEEIMDSSRAVPFSNKVSVDKEEIYDIISEIRMKLPTSSKSHIAISTVANSSKSLRLVCKKFSFSHCKSACIPHRST